MSTQEEKDPIRELEEQLRTHDLASTARGAGSSVRLVDSFRKMSKTERRYQLRRLAVVLIGFSIPLALTAGAYWLKSSFEIRQIKVEKEFVGEFPIRARISSEFNTLPGGPPRLRVSAQPVGSEDWTTVFEVTALTAEKLDEVYAEFVTSQVAFALYDTLYAVTTNGGHQWEIITVHDTLSGKALVVDGVILDETGSGFLFPPGVKSLDSCWTTEDFGNTWDAP
jgi:hypothetical protein